MAIEQAMKPNAKDMSAGGHFVQFYEDDGYLVDSVSAYVAASLGVGEGAIVIATREHRDALDLHLRQRGIDVSAAFARSQYVCLDARETLGLFMVDGLPDEKRFHDTIGKSVAQSVRAWKRLRAFGEMVALLWAEGNREGAIKLEKLWNNLGTTQPFTLFCAYPMSGFRGDTESPPYTDVCHEHSHVLRQPNEVSPVT
jgi:hypothetical protein